MKTHKLGVHTIDIKSSVEDTWIGWLGFMAYQPCRLFNAKSIFMQIVLFQTIQFNMSTQFNHQKHFYFKLFTLFKLF